LGGGVAVGAALAVGVPSGVAVAIAAADVACGDDVGAPLDEVQATTANPRASETAIEACRCT
jgi:hypothetical protein